jgi:hypothetical protein
MRTDLLALLEHLQLLPPAGPPGPEVLATLRQRLEASARPLSKLHWKGADLEGALAGALAALGRHRLDGAMEPVAFLEAMAPLLGQGLPDAELRARQLEHLAGCANRLLEARGDERRFCLLGPALAWRDGEPAWLLVVPEEAAALAAVAGAPAPA